LGNRQLDAAERFDEAPPVVAFVLRELALLLGRVINSFDGMIPPVEGQDEAT
jgi:hypothetical protein